MKKTILSFPPATLLFIILLFNCCKKKELPQLLTSDVTEITESSATGGGVILSDGGEGISAKGVCWSTDSDPTIDNNKKLETENPESFVSKITGLNPNTTYYIRAFAINSVGTGYGSEISFKTHGDVPAVTTKPASNVSSSNVFLNGSVNPNRLLTTISFEYGLTENYGQTITSIPETLTGNSATNVSATLTGLSPGTQHWLSPNTGANNSSGFTGLGSGYRDLTGIYVGLKQLGYMWSSTEYSPTHGMSRKLFYDFESTSFSANYKQSGFAVRCIID